MSSAVTCVNRVNNSCLLQPSTQAPTHLSLVQTQGQVRLVSDGVHQDAVLDRPEVQLDVKPVPAPSPARGRLDLVRQQPVLEVVTCAGFVTR